METELFILHIFQHPLPTAIINVLSYNYLSLTGQLGWKSVLSDIIIIIIIKYVSAWLNSLLCNLLQITSALQAEALWNMGFTGALLAALTL